MSSAVITAESTRNTVAQVSPDIGQLIDQLPANEDGLTWANYMLGRDAVETTLLGDEFSYTHLTHLDAFNLNGAMWVYYATKSKDGTFGYSSRMVDGEHRWGWDEAVISLLGKMAYINEDTGKQRPTPLSHIDDITGSLRIFE